MYKGLNTLIRTSFLTLSLMLSSGKSLMATEEFKDKSEEVLYKQGLVYRDAGDTRLAMECFQPLAEKGYVKAQHNLAMNYLTLEDEQQAYSWFKCASDKGFKPSHNNLKKMNLLCLLLPDEVLSHIISFLSMKDLLSLTSVSHRFHSIASAQIIYTNYLDPINPNAKDVSSLFNKVVFEPQPKAIRLVRLAETEEDSVEVRFRDSQHLRNIVEQIPLIKSGGKVYFVRDEKAEEGKELVPLKGKLKKSYFIHVVADGPVKLKGDLKLLCNMILPPQSDFTTELKLQGKAVSAARLGTYHDAYDVAEMIDTFNEDLFRIRTTDAHSLLESRANRRLKNPDQFPNLGDLCDNFLLLSNSTIKVLQKDYIEADKPLIYIANCISDIEKLRMKLPEFSESIGYIEPESKASGVYCAGPLSLRKGFEVHTDGHLTLTGKIYIPDYNFSIFTGEGIWGFAPMINAAGISFTAGTSLYTGPLYRTKQVNIKPENMPEEEWQRFLTEGERFGFFN